MSAVATASDLRMLDLRVGVLVVMGDPCCRTWVVIRGPVIKV